MARNHSPRRLAIAGVTLAAGLCLATPAQASPASDAADWQYVQTLGKLHFQFRPATGNITEVGREVCDQLTSGTPFRAVWARLTLAYSPDETGAIVVASHDAYCPTYRNPDA